MITFLHTSDWQLGMTRHFLDDDAQPRFSAARIDAVRTIGKIAEEEHASFVVVCGDAFESNHVERRVVVRALEAMGSAATTFYLLPGNHDPLDASSVYLSPTFAVNRPENVVVLDGAGPRATPHGVELVAAPWGSKRPVSDLVTEAVRRAPTDGAARVAVGHGTVDELAPDPERPGLIRVADLEESLEEGRIRYVALGDRHSRKEVGTSGRILYCGTPEATDYRERDPGHVLVVRLDGNGIDVASRRVGSWRFVQQDFDLGGAVDVDRVRDWLDELADKDRTIVKLALVGALPLREKARLEEVLEHYSDLLAALETWERRSELVVLPDDGDLAEMGLSGFAGQALWELRDLAAGEGGEALVARDSLALLYRLARPVS